MPKKQIKKPKSKSKETVIVFSSHSDDFVLGAGGTIANYVQQGKEVIAIIFSYGEKSHPWLKEKFIQNLRIKETIQAGKVLGCKTLFFNLDELNFYEDYQKKKLEHELLAILLKKKPVKIFTHSSEDPHPDHRAVHKITLELYQKVQSDQEKPEIYTYAIWNPVSFRTSYPSLYSNITKNFSLKFQALKQFKSQKFNAIYPLFIPLLFKSIKDGLKIRAIFGERFFRIK